MSEAEKQRRLLYKLNRQKWIQIQFIVLCSLLAVTMLFSMLFIHFNQAYYINYTESSDVDYRVLLKENDFYEGDYAEEGKAYVSELIDKVFANFQYEMLMDAQKVNFEYSYKIDAILQVKDAKGIVIYDKVYPLIPEKTVEETGNSVFIYESVAVDYGTYNDMAEEFVQTYQLKNTSSCIVIKMSMHVIGACEEFCDDASNAYVATLNVPLSAQTVTMSVSSSVEEGDNQLLARENESAKNVFKTLTIIFVSLSVIDLIAFALFIYLTRNHDINYEIQVKRIFNSYKSYIQRINNPFDQTGYQILYVKTISEMLEIRDTIQSPILACENEDKTMTQFLIPTNTKILYVFEIKVGDYDEIYAEPVEEPVVETEEPIILDENVDAEALDQAMHQPDVDLDQIEFVQDDDDQFAPAPEEPGIEVIGVVWPERAHKNKVYRYDPNGEVLHEGDIVLVPTRDAARDKEIIRKAAVAHGNHMVDPEHIKHPLKKIIGVIKRNIQKTIDPVPEKTKKQK